MKNYIENVQSSVIDWVRFPLAIAVVFIHSWSIPVDYIRPSFGMESFTGLDFLNILRICFSHVMTQISVPAFFFISGFLFFYKIKQWNVQIYQYKLKKRFFTLILPYIMWNIIPVLLIVATCLASYFIKGNPLDLGDLQSQGWHLFWDVTSLGGSSSNWFGMTLAPGFAPINYPLWFLRDLIVTVFLTPLIFFFVKRLKIVGILLLGFCYVTKLFPQVPGLSINALFFFSFGAYFSINKLNFIEFFQKRQTLIGVLTVVFLAISIYFDGNHTIEGRYVYPFYIILGIMSLFNIVRCLVEKGKANRCQSLAKYSFFIYATHTVVILKISSQICTSLLYNNYMRGVMNETFLLTLLYLVTPLLAVCICILLYHLCARLFPTTLSLLTGSR